MALGGNVRDAGETERESTSGFAASGEEFSRADSLAESVHLRGQRVLVEERLDEDRGRVRDEMGVEQARKLAFSSSSSTTTNAITTSRRIRHKERKEPFTNDAKAFTIQRNNNER